MNKKLHFLLCQIFLISVTISSYAQPAAPTSIVAFPSYSGVIEIVIRWEDAADNETGFEIERRTGGGGWMPVGSPGANPGLGQVEWRDNTIALDVLYEYQIRAVNADGNSGWTGPTEETQLPTNNIWPRDDGVRDIMLIWSASSGNTQRYHEGLDFHAIEPVPTPMPVIQAVRGGTMATTTFWGPGLTVAVEVEVAAGVYQYDYYLHLEDLTAKGVGDQIAPGEYLGRISTIYGVGWRHMHLMRMVANSMGPSISNARSPWLDFSLPAELDPFDNDPQLLDQTGDPVDSGPDGRVLFAVDATAVGTIVDPVRGDVDVLAEAADDMNTTLAYENTVSAMGYWIESQVTASTDIASAAAPLRLHDFDDTWFTDLIPISNSYDDVFDDSRRHSGSFWSTKTFHHILTSATTGSADPADADGSRFWRTKARTGSGTAPYYDDALFSRHNGEGRFKDGRYTVHVLMSDQIHIDVEETRDLIVDNWLPYVVSVETQSTELLSHALWTFNTATEMMNIDFPAGVSDLVHAGDNEVDINFTITFSEPMATASLEIPSVSWASTTVALTPNADFTVWTGMLPGGSAPGGVDVSGLYFLHIDGTDLAGNDLSGRANFSPFDPQVDLDPVIGFTGTDNTHRFSIASRRDIVLVLDRSGSMSGVSPGFSSKIAALQDAGNIFLDLLIPSTTMNLGGVKYDDVYEPLCPTCIIGPATLSQIDDIRTGIMNLTARNMTSIGGALTEAASQLSTVGDDKNLVLLFTDGKHNTDPSVASGLTAIHALVPDNTTISAIGFGSGSSINIPQLETIVNSTFGELLVTTSGLELHKFFIEALMNAGGTPYSIFISDPIASINQGETDEKSFTVNSYDRQVAVVVDWGNTSGQLAVTIRSPNNRIITPTTATTVQQISYTGGNSYAIYQLNFPLGTSDSDTYYDDWQGLWHIQVDAAAITKSSLDYSYSVLSSSDICIDVDVIGGHIAGSDIYVLAKLLYKGQPIDGHLSAIVDYPARSIANTIGSIALTDRQIQTAFKKLKKDKKTVELASSPSDIYQYAVQKYYGDLVSPSRIAKSITLSSKSTVPDIKLSKGEYLLKIPETNAAGDYRITIAMNSMGDTQYKGTGSKFITHVLKPKFNVESTKIEVYSHASRYFLKKDPQHPLFVEITPQDRFGNLLGGDLINTNDLLVDAKGGDIEQLWDKGNGTYLVKIIPDKEGRQVKIIFTIFDKKFTISAKSDGTYFTKKLQKG